MPSPSDSFDFASWPPTLSNGQLEALTLYATTYALSHGLLYLAPAQRQPTIPSAAIHAPISLFPSPVPRALFDNGRRLQRIYNVLYARIAMDDEFLDEVMGAEKGVGKVDKFIGELWRGWKRLRDEGLPQPLHLGLFRSDYLLHSLPDKPLSIKQVEFNTISVSFGCLSQKVAELHRYLLSQTKYYYSSPYLSPSNFPSNETTPGLASGLAEAHKAYGDERSQILFVVQPGERNVFDQRPLEYELLERYGIHSIRNTFEELGNIAHVDPSTSALIITRSLDGSPSERIEISTVYYRSGYVPHEYPTPKHYTTRFLIESSKAIKCPTISLQLAGGKKVQEVLGRPGVLERFLADEAKYGKDVYGPEVISELRDSFMDMWSLDVNEDRVTPDRPSSESGNEEFGTRLAREGALGLVLKPQREGGGNNVYKESIPTFLDTLDPEERQAWIAMELIQPPKDFGNYLIRAGSTNSQSQTPVKTEVVSELGIFGWALFGGPEKSISEKEVGWLVRTKGKDSNEGGVATGFSVLDSLLLVD
ncbi:glutathione synthase [Pholiota conissans]|uniref:Glutathione synthetase n=1 Tax=Pholiota conissans TaxID=109636 RepID=A0A9P5YZ85_9AGAR|nr:glutathione synthase [Pholiota conissans]